MQNFQKQQSIHGILILSSFAPEGLVNNDRAGANLEKSPEAKLKGDEIL